MTEIWKMVPGFEPYEASSLGRVRRMRRRGERILAGRLDEDGYRRMKISIDGVPSDQFCHKLICLAFHGPKPSERHSVAHWDQDIANNKEENLRWATPEDQWEDRQRHGTHNRGAQHFAAKLTWEAVREIRATHVAGSLKFGQKALARKFGVSDFCISRVVKGKGWVEA